MSLVEKEITMQNIERANQSPEFANSREREQKFVATRVWPSEFLFKHNARPIEQVYLSTPEDEFNLRVRCVYSPAGNEYTATLKDDGKVINGARDRLEVSTPISQAAYERCAQNEALARIHKLRTEIQDGVIVDFIDGLELPVFEIEHTDVAERARLANDLQFLLNDPMIERTGDKTFDNEHLAYSLSGIERGATPESLDDFTERVLGEIVAHYVSGKNQVVVGLTGMSGSGKTTVTKALQERITELYGESFKPIVLSTDDYHFGKTKLEEVYGAPYSEWDDAKTYNTAELAFDLAQLAEGVPIIKRHFDFDTEEPAFDEEIAPSPFVIVEGLYAGSTDLVEVRDLHFKLPTSIATSIGRDVRRLIIDDRKNRAFPTAASRLKYQIETAAPLYLEQEMPRRKAFSASTRPLAQRAFMLAKLAET
jgi:uridine kinase